MAAIFELDTIKDLPLWAQVLIASRLCRRAALWLPVDAPPGDRESLIAACEALDRCAKRGERPSDSLRTIENAVQRSPVRDARPAYTALYYAADAAHAAESSLDFEAAEAACSSSVVKAMVSVAEQVTLSPIQVRIFCAADLDLLRFACKEQGVGRYDGLGEAVFGRLAPVTAPNPGDIRVRPVTDPDSDHR